MVKKLILLIALCFFIIPATSFAAPDEQEAYDSFEMMIQNHLASYETNNRGGIGKMGYDQDPDPFERLGWKRYYYTADAEYTLDIQKTNSVVSPFVATYVFKLSRYSTAPRATKEEAEADNNFRKVATHYHRHTFAYQRGQWVRKTREHSRDQDYWFADDKYKVDETCKEVL